MFNDSALYICSFSGSKSLHRNKRLLISLINFIISGVKESWSVVSMDRVHKVLGSI